MILVWYLDTDRVFRIFLGVLCGDFGTVAAPVAKHMFSDRVTPAIGQELPTEFSAVWAYTPNVNKIVSRLHECE